MKGKFLILACGLSLAAGASPVDDAKTDLLAAVDSYEAGTIITEETRRRIDAAATALEQAAGDPPDLVTHPERVAGLWTNLFSSQGVVGEIDLAFMTRALPGGGQEGGKARSLTVLQELDPKRRFYRNMMTMTAGDESVPFLYIATADLGIDADKSNDMTVQFETIVFAPGRADVSLEDLRAALKLSPGTPLSVDVPQDPQRPPSTSTVTYVDDDLRVNRGKDYFAVLRKVR